MAYKITVIPKPTYTHFIVKGDNTVEDTLQYYQELYDECIAHNYRTILIEEHLEGKKIGTTDIYGVAEKATKYFFGFFKAIAYAIVPADKETINFIENLCVNRSLPLHAFKTVEEAEQWLKSRQSE
jgi:hypothetical protein